MDLSFYSDPVLYDLAFTPGSLVPFYTQLAGRAGPGVLELGCGTGQLLAPIAARGHRAVGLDLAPAMLAAARARAPAAVFVEGDMRAFDLGETFGLVFVARNSLLHLHGADELLACFACVRRHLRPGGIFAFDVFNPNVALLARAPGERAEVMRLRHPERGTVLAEQTSDYDAAAQVNRATWYFSARGAPDFLVAPLHLRSIFPQELPLLLAAAGLTLDARHGGFAGETFTGQSARQVCLCRAA